MTRVRVINDFGKSCRFTTAMNLLKLFGKAREHGYDHVLSVKYAMLQQERMSWHGGKAIDLYETRWHTNNRIVTTPERFISLINSPYETDITMTDLVNLNPSSKTFTNESAQLMANKIILTGKNKKTKLLLKAIRNYKTVTNLKKLHARIILGLAGMDHEPIYRLWLKVKRGRDLFILGKFDILNVVKSLPLREATLAPWLIQARAYNISPWHMRLLVEPENVRKLAYVKRYINWWRTGNNMARLDELLFMDNVDLSLTPQIALRRAVEERIENERKKRKRLQEEYPWVKNKFPPIETPIGTLVPISTRRELLEVGDKMHNCAAGYASVIQDEEYLLVALVQDGKYIALCQYDKRGTLLQCYGPCNNKVSEEVEKVFKNFNPKW